MVVSTYALESMVYLTAGLIDRGLEDYSLEGACCKVFGTEAVWRNINDALQIAGGNGFMEDYPYEKALRDSRINMIFEGTNEILRVLVALSGMRDVGEDLKEVGRALKAPLTSLGILSDYAAKKFKVAVTPGRLTKIAPELASQGEIVARYARAAHGAVETLLKKYGKGVIEKEYHQERLANIAIDLYASVAVLSRATATIARRGAEQAARGVRGEGVVEAPSTAWSDLKEMDKNRDAPSPRSRRPPRRPVSFSYWTEHGPSLFSRACAPQAAKSVAPRRIDKVAAGSAAWLARGRRPIRRELGRVGGFQEA
jgi:hypothetical protein